MKYLRRLKCKWFGHYSVGIVDKEADILTFTCPCGHQTFYRASTYGW